MCLLWMQRARLKYTIKSNVNQTFRKNLFKNDPRGFGVLGFWVEGIKAPVLAVVCGLRVKGLGK